MFFPPSIHHLLVNQIRVNQIPLFGVELRGKALQCIIHVVEIHFTLDFVLHSVRVLFRYIEGPQKWYPEVEKLVVDSW